MRSRAVVVVAFLFFVSLAVSAATTPPVITSLSPVDTVAGTGQLDVEVFGANFVSGAIVRANNANRPTTFIDTGHLRVTLISGDVNLPGTISMVVANPSGGGVSSAVNFTVLPNSPTISSLNPTTIFTGSGAQTLHVTGSNFASTAKVRVNNSDRTTTFIDSSHLDAALTASDVSSNRTLTITVVNPFNKTSNSQTVTVSNVTPTPTITLLNPDTVAAGGAAFDLAITGKDFVNGAQARVNGTARTTTFVSATQLTMRVLASDITIAGTPQITVRNPDGKTSAAATLTVTGQNQPQLTSISPNQVTAKSPAFTLTATGTNFLNGAKINVNSSAHSATFVNSTTLTTTILASEIVNAGQLTITVTNPGSGAVTSSAQILTVLDEDAPVVTSLNPVSVAAGSGATSVLINGSGFVSTDTVYFNGAQRTMSFINATQVAISLTAADIAIAGQFPITVKHINGATSAALLFNISDTTGGPVITSLSPNIAPVSGAPFTLTINGTGFSEESVVSFDGTPRSTTFVNITRLTVPVFASDLTSARQIAVTVLTPGFPESTSAPLTIAVIPPVITSITPSSVAAGELGTTLTVNGTGFSSSSVISVGGTPHLTQFDAATGSVSTSILASELTTATTLDVTVADRGITSNVMKLTVARPSISSLTPSSINAGSAALTLTVHGTNFVPSSKIVLNGTELTTTVNPDGSLSATLTTADLEVPRILPVVVRNTAGAESFPALLSILSPGQPSILQINPQTITAGAQSQELIVTGINFLTSSRIAVNGTPRQTTFVSSNELRTTLTAADLATAGSLSITVVNEDGTISSPVTLTLTFNGPPPPRRRSAGH